MDTHPCEPPESGTFKVTFPGPFSHHDVVVDGWRVPFIQAQMVAEDRVALVIDRRLATEFSVEEAERVVPFVADAIAFALGFGAHPNREMESLPRRDPLPGPVKSIEIDSPDPRSDRDSC
jgi:hypothetical protein